ncbi:Ktr system potassium uptake protein C [Gottschalkia acidurici 9a]|uniref:Ktr system potassium uptake protein C n=1 Tax=Gottschalkia acidurici (strain ATCC 7906 / DSM 604 / BCRC 14475 / CIP 104303 / KCTC 5404 / NCIMB 10678 / 9a) TaxID=1128398 RepID=K0AYS1_GOTA9|nr:TrkA family potassium uptake protein [Gottschalkia acidurici]AFS77927.1 Ktr system potassium uptake protein C [Gottschalkia acidurici 9a]
MKKQFVVIGCGRFGQGVAKTLCEYGHEVLVLDEDEEIIQEVSEYVTHAIQVDATDESALKSIGIRNFDIAIISIGADIQASILATLIAKEEGVKTVVAKAQNNVHAKVLYKIGADRVVFPERDMGIRLANSLVTSNVLDYIELTQDYNVVEIEAPKDWVDKKLSELKLSNRYGINVIAIKQGDNINISPYAESVIQKGDILIFIGDTESLRKLED